jgi:hypothetical protein
MSMVYPLCAADLSIDVLASHLQPGKLRSCISQHHELAGDDTLCYSWVALREGTGLVAEPGRARPEIRMLTPSSDEGGSSPPRGRKPGKHRVGVSTLTCRHPTRVTQPHNERKVALPPSTAGLVAHRSKSGRTILARPRRTVPRPAEEHRQHGSAQQSHATSIRGTRTRRPECDAYYLSAGQGKAARPD